MSEFNFDKLKNHEIPDSWVSGALNVPPKEKKPPIVFVKYSKALAFVATFVVVCALSVTLFIFTQKGDTLLNTPIQNTVEETFPTQSVINPTENNSDTESKTEATKPQESQTISPTKRVDETVKDTITETVKPTQRPTQQPSDKPTTPNPDPSTPSSPSMKPNTPDKDPDGETDEKPPSTNPDADKKPNGDATSTPNGGSASGELNGGASASSKIVCSDTISLETYLSDPEIYFYYYSNTPEDLSGGTTSKSKKADIILTNGQVIIEYKIDIKDENLESGEYQYIFYNSKNTILSYGTITVN